MCSEVVRRPDPNPVDPARCHAGHAAVLGDVIALDLHVRVDVPVHAECPIVELAALDAFIIQVQVTEAYAQLPRAAATEGIALLAMEVVQRDHAAEHSLVPVVTLNLAGEEVEGLD